jgi:glycosyltransferase involved in cell wall biosynthesis
MNVLGHPSESQSMFTVIIPTHERPMLLRRTLHSLIGQTYQNFNVVIVDDSPAYIPPYQEFQALAGRYTYIIRSGASGPAESRNMGLLLANSKYIVFLDDDDTFEPGHLQSLADGIGTDSPELVFCDFKVCYEDRTQSPPTQLSVDDVMISDVTKDSVFVRNRIPNSCLVYRKAMLADLQHDINMQIYEDWDFLLSCLHGNPLTYLAINSVVIHKSQPTAPENMRRGNTRHDLTAEVMLELYRKHPAPNTETRLARQALLSSAGVVVSLEVC